MSLSRFVRREMHTELVNLLYDFPDKFFPLIKRVIPQITNKETPLDPPRNFAWGQSGETIKFTTSVDWEDGRGEVEYEGYWKVPSFINLTKKRIRNTRVNGYCIKVDLRPVKKLRGDSKWVDKECVLVMPVALYMSS